MVNNISDEVESAGGHFSAQTKLDHRGHPKEGNIKNTLRKRTIFGERNGTGFERKLEPTPVPLLGTSFGSQKRSPQVKIQ